MGSYPAPLILPMVVVFTLDAHGDHYYLKMEEFAKWRNHLGVRLKVGIEFFVISLWKN